MSGPLSSDSTDANVPAVKGTSTTGVAVVAISDQGEGLYAQGPGNGIHAESVDKSGVWGNSSGTGNGISGSAQSGTGVGGSSQSGNGASGESQSGNGVSGTTHATGFAAGLVGLAPNPNGTEAMGVYAQSKGKGAAGFFDNTGGGTAGYFIGNVIVTGDIQLANADCAEDFEIAGLEKVEPGTVMVIDSEGKLQQSEQAYDKRVAGVISGAGKYKPGLILGREESSAHRMPIALMGKVYCKVDAQFAAIAVGDLLRLCRKYFLVTNEVSRSHSVKR